MKRTEITFETPLMLLEAGGESTGPFNEDGTVNVCVIRPGLSKGIKGRRAYRPEMLEAQAEMFKGWPVFDNHESPGVRKARGPMPRPPSDLRGEIVESWWDPKFTQSDDKANDFVAGGVMGRVSPTRDTRELIEACPNTIKLSVKTFATGIKRGTFLGHAADIVEAFDDSEVGSVDMVTRAGAGGRVLAVLEAGYDQEHGPAERALSDLGDDDLVHHLREHRPHLLEAAAAPGDNDPDRGVEEDDHMAETKGGVTIKDVLTSTEFKDALKDTVTEIVEAAVTAAMPAERELIEAGASKRTQRAIEIRDLHGDARRLIEDSKLPPTFQDDLRARYALVEAGGEMVPTAALNVTAVMDGDTVTKSARVVLEEALTADITRERLKLAEARPTRVRGQGATTVGDGEQHTRHERSARRGGSFRDGLTKSGVQLGRASEVNAQREGK